MAFIFARALRRSLSSVPFRTAEVGVFSWPIDRPFTVRNRRRGQGDMCSRHSMIGPDGNDTVTFYRNTGKRYYSKKASEKENSSAIEVVEENLKDDTFETIRIDQHLTESAWHLMRNRFDKSIEHYNHVIDQGFVLEDDKIGAVSYHGRAHCFQQKGMYNRAIEDYLSSLQFDKGNALAVSCIAECLQAQGRTESALKRYNEALAMKPDLVPALGGRADLLLNLGDTEGALRDYYAVKKKDPGNFRALLGLGEVFLVDGNIEKALEMFVLSIESLGEVLKIHSERESGMVPLPIDSVDEDRQWLTGVEAVSFAADPWIGLAMCQYLKDNLDAAQKALEYANLLLCKEKDPPNAKRLKISHMSALIKLAQEKYEEVSEICEQSTQFTGGQMVPTIVYAYVLACLQLSKWEVAGRCAEEFVTHAQSGAPSTAVDQSDSLSIATMLLSRAIARLHIQIDGNTLLQDSVIANGWESEWPFRLSAQYEGQEVTETLARKIEDCLSTLPSELNEMKGVIRDALEAMDEYPTQTTEVATFIQRVIELCQAASSSRQ